MSDYDEAVKKGAIRVPGYRPPGGTVAAAEERREKEEQLKKSSGGGSGNGCFVATAAFGDYNAPEVIFLRMFRDELLSQRVVGRGFIRAYNTLSPPLAAVIARSNSLRAIVRKFFLQPAIFLLRHFKNN